MEKLYKQDMQGIVKDSRSALSEIGISVGRDGRLSVDADKLAQATPEALKKLFGSKSPFTSKLATLTEKIGDNTFRIRPAQPPAMPM